MKLAEFVARVEKDVKTFERFMQKDAPDFEADEGDWYEQLLAYLSACSDGDSIAEDTGEYGPPEIPSGPGD